MKAILAGTKNVFQNYEVYPISAPRFRELSVSKMLAKVDEVVAVKSFLPDDVSEKNIERTYLFNVSTSQVLISFVAQIINTVYPQYFAAAIPEAHEKRKRPEK